MIPEGEAPKQKRNTFKWISFVILLIIPALYIVVAYFVTRSSGETIAVRESGQTNLMFNILLIVSLILPSIYPFFEKSQIKAFRKGKTEATDTVGIYQTVSITKYAMIIACYVFGLAMIFTTKDMSYLIYFYPIGIVWTIIYWPKESKFIEFKRKLESV